jgi:hypothetical protein
MPREGGASSNPWYQFCFTMRAAAYWIARSSRAMIGEKRFIATD